MSTRLLPQVKDQVEKSQTDAARKIQSSVVRIASELEDLLRIHVWARECLQNELTQGMGFKQMALSEKDLKKLRELTVSMAHLAETKIKWDKADKILQDSLTPAQERDAVFKYIMNLSGDERTLLRERLADNGVWKFKGRDEDPDA